MARVKLNTLTYENYLIGGYTSTQRHHLNIIDGRPAAEHGLPTITYVQSPNYLTANTWTHIAVVYNVSNQVMRMDINGDLVDSAFSVPAAPMQTGAMDLQLSRYGTGPVTHGINGFMIDNKVYKVPLNAAQIAAIYNFELTSKAGY